MLFGSSYYIFPVAGGVAYFVWQLPINIGAGPELEFNWNSTGRSCQSTLASCGQV